MSIPITGVAWLIPSCTHHDPLLSKSNGYPGTAWSFRCSSGWWPGSLRLPASGEHTIHPCPERSILCARRAST
jgi:hypothetical protein